MEELKQQYLSRLPDIPRWVETRDLLFRPGSTVIENLTQDGFVVWSKEDEIGSVVGQPDPVAIVQAAEDVSELLAFPENFKNVNALLEDFRAERATIFSAPTELPPISGHPCRQIGLEEIKTLEHLPEDLLEELSDDLKEETLVIAALDDAVPVALAYVASETESLWDLSIDTVESHRRKGYATAAVVQLMHLMKKRGKDALWGALESNQASDNLAKRLGFQENDKLWVLTRSTTEHERRKHDHNRNTAIPRGA